MFPLNAEEEAALLALLCGRYMTEPMEWRIAVIKDRMLEREEYRRLIDQAARDRA